MIKEAIAQLVKREDLTSEVMEQVMEEIMTGEATDAQKASFLTALSMKGETIDEITSAAKVLRSHCERFLNDMDVLEIVGTGGDGSNTINISTLSSVVVSAAGIPVAKHGNRAASSKCGTADCLEALGVKIDCAPARSAQILKDINLCFLFAQKYHPAMRFVGAVRKEMGIRTLFNVLGPLANPAGATMQLFGVYSEELVVPLAHVLRNLVSPKSSGLITYDLNSSFLNSHTLVSALREISSIESLPYTTIALLTPRFLNTCASGSIRKILLVEHHRRMQLSLMIY